MKIGPLDNGNGPLKSEELRKRTPEDAACRNKAGKTKDSVEISRNGRHLSDTARLYVTAGPVKSIEAKESPVTVESNELRNEKIDLARQRIESGFYNDSAVRQEIARRFTDDLLG